MGFGSFLSNGLTAASNTVGAYQGAEQKASQDRMAQALQQMAIQRQQAQDLLNDRLKNSQIGHYNAQATKDAAPPRDPVADANAKWDYELGHPKPTAEGTPLPSTEGYVNRDGTPIVGKNGQPIMPPSMKPAPETKDHFTFITTTGPDGKQVITRANTATGALEQTDTQAKAGAAGGSQTSAQAAIAMQRLGMSLANVEAAHARMTRMENDPAFRQKLTVANQAIGNAADVKPDIHASGLMGALNNAGGSMVAGMAQKHLAENDPDLNTYRRDKETVGTALTEVLPRPNQQLLQIEKGLSGIDAGWNPALTAAAQSRRANGVTQLKQALSALQAGRGGAASVVPATPHVTPAERSALKAQGYTDAQIDAYKP